VLNIDIFLFKMATMTLRVASVQGGCNGIIHSESKDMCALTVASNHIDGASKYCQSYGSVFSNAS
jgi:hypothetical protein